MLSATLLTVGACKTTESMARPPRQPSIAPSYDDIARTHNTRVTQLSELMTGGVVEITWTEADGDRRREQGDVDLYYRGPDRTAMVITKFGDRYAWIGSNATHYWLFEIKSEPPRAYFGRHDGDERIEAFGLAADPRMVLDLLGLTPFPTAAAVTEAGGSPDVSYDAAHDGWRIARPLPDGGRLAITVDLTRLRPTVIDVFNPAGEPIAQSVLRAYEAVSIEGVNELAAPSLATNVTIDATDGSGRIRFVLANPSDGVSFGESQIQDRFFDPAWLIKVNRPEIIEGDRPAS